MKQIILNSILLTTWIVLLVVWLVKSSWVASGIEVLAIVVQTAALVLSIHNYKRRRSI